MIAQRRIPLVVGGCAYQLAVRAEHAISIATLATYVASDEARAAHSDEGREDPTYEIACDYQHTSNLPQGRCQWIGRAVQVLLASGHTRGLAVSIDSDTSFDAGDLLLSLSTIDDDVAIACAPVRVGGTTLVNLNLTKQHEKRGPTVDRMSIDELTKLLGSDKRDIESGGFGLAVFNLAWFAKRWPQPTPEGIELMVGEDIAMCRSVKKRGGRVIALRVRTMHHEFRP